MPRGGLTDATVSLPGRRQAVGDARRVVSAIPDAGSQQSREAARGAPARHPTRSHARSRRAPAGRRRARTPMSGRSSRARGSGATTEVVPRHRSSSRRFGRTYADLAALPTSFCASASDGIRSRDAVEHARARVLLVRLGGVPQHEHLLGRLGDLAGEDVRMPPHHLVGQAPGDVVDVERDRPGLVRRSRRGTAPATAGRRALRAARRACPVSTASMSSALSSTR